MQARSFQQAVKWPHDGRSVATLAKSVGIQQNTHALGERGYPAINAGSPGRAVRFTAIPALLAVVMLAGCGRPVAHDAASGGGMPAVRATVIQPQRKVFVRTVDLPGRVEAFEFAPLCAKVTGFVLKVPVDIGDPIHGPKGDQPGSILCELLVPELNEELSEKTAAIAQTKAEILQADAGVKVAEAFVLSADAHIGEAEALVAKEESRHARWKSEYQRVAQLAENGAVTRKVADETKSELEAADAGRREVTAKIAAVKAMRLEAAARLEKARADAVAIRARLDVAHAEKRRVETMLDYSILRAPFDGVVVERNVHRGHLVQAGGGTGQKPLLSVMRVDPVRVFIDIPENDAVHVAKGSKVELRVPSMHGKPHVGTITRTSWSLNTTSRTLTAEIDVPNPDGLWRPGLYVQAKVTVAELKDVFTLPKLAIITHDKQTYCQTVGADGKVARRAVSLGLHAGPEVEIREGLTGDEQVITVNANTFREGQTVEIAAPAK